MGRRFNILVGMALAVAVVVPFAFAQRQDPSARTAAEGVPNLDEPPIDTAPLPPLTESDAKGIQDIAKPSAKANGKAKSNSRTPKSAAPKKDQTQGGSELGPEPTPREPLSAGTPATTGAEASKSDPRRSTTEALSDQTPRPPGTSLPGDRALETRLNEDEREVPAMPAAAPLDKPLPDSKIADGLPPAGTPRAPADIEAPMTELGETELGQPPRANGGTIDREIMRSQAPAPAGPGAVPVDPKNPLPPALNPAGDLNKGANAQLLPAASIPLIGKQTFGLTVDVQSPRFANVNQEAMLKIVVRNGSEADALQVVVADQLPEELLFVSSVPQAALNDRILVWALGKIPAGGEKTITVRVKPTKVGAFDHAATVTMFAGGKSRTIVREPKLKVEQVVSKADVEKGQEVEFKIKVSNTGDGPARDVLVQAKLSPGLHHESGKKGEPTIVEFPIAKLEAGYHVDIEPLFVDTIAGGDQTCSVVVTSRDVAPANEAKSVQTVRVVEPKLELKLTGPVEQYTDTEAVYTLTVTNPGTAVARNITVRATLQVSGQLMAASPGYKYDANSKNLDWIVPQLEPNGTQKFSFRVRMGAVGEYRVNAVARGGGGLLRQQFVLTSVTGMADVSFTVTEPRRVVSVNDETIFTVKITNTGSKDATNVLVAGKYSETIDVLGGIDDPDEKDPSPALNVRKETHDISFAGIPSLPHGKSRVLSVRVRAVKAGIAGCEFTLMHDDLENTKLNASAIVRVRGNGEATGKADGNPGNGTQVR